MSYERRRVRYDADQRAIAKRDKLGLFCIDVVDAHGEGATYSGPAGAIVVAALRRFLLRIVKLREQELGRKARKKA